MPSEKITTTVVNNGPNDVHPNTLHVQWGKIGAAPDAPDGWVNQGYAMLYVDHGDKAARVEHYVDLDAQDIDRLITVLRRVKRHAFREPALPTLPPEYGLSAPLSSRLNSRR